MSAFHLIEELKFENINFDSTVLPKHNPYIGYLPWRWPYICIQPTHKMYKNASTQTENSSYFELGKKVATEYGDGWELLCDSGPTLVAGTE